MKGYVDLHCHLLWGLDDGARALEDSLEMARVLVDLGYAAAAPSPHAWPDLPPRAAALQRLEEVRGALLAAAIPLELAPNAENRLLDEAFHAQAGTPKSRVVGSGPYALVEAPYHAPVPALTEIIFRLKLKGMTPLLAHPERCLEFEKKGRAAEAVRAGAALQLDLGSLIGEHGSMAKKLARSFLEEGLYAVAASDLHSPEGAREALGEAMAELRSRVGEEAFLFLVRDAPSRILRGETLES
ncbi:MAG: protein tyrosine phosphatase [Myxococcales bacterium]|nr:protein tyrosine phosphatase [Myxococcales bacterium]